MRKNLLLIVTANIAAAPICAADNPAATVESRGLVGTWASYCTAGADRKAAALRIIVAAPPGGAASFTTVNAEDGVATTVNSEVLEAAPAGPGQLKLRLRIVGGERDGGQHLIVHIKQISSVLRLVERLRNDQCDAIADVPPVFRKGGMVNLKHRATRDR